MYDARAVLAHLAQQRPDLIVCDMHMPDLDGLTLARWIRESGFLCPIVLMSAGPIPAIDLPSVRVAQKSIEMDELLELLTEELA